MARILDIPIQAIQRPLYRQNDLQRVDALMTSSVFSSGCHNIRVNSSNWMADYPNVALR